MARNSDFSNINRHRPSNSKEYLQIFLGHGQIDAALLFCPSVKDYCETLRDNVPPLVHGAEGKAMNLGVRDVHVHFVIHQTELEPTHMHRFRIQGVQKNGITGFTGFTGPNFISVNYILRLTSQS
jgi:hypothetical protein